LVLVDFGGTLGELMPDAEDIWEAEAYKIKAVDVITSTVAKEPKTLVLGAPKLVVVPIAVCTPRILGGLPGSSLPGPPEGPC